MDRIQAACASEYEKKGGKYEVIDYHQACQNTDIRQAAHVFIFARQDGVLWFYKKHAAIMMQMRFDGQLGFPGGLVDEGESPVEALNRELVEEIGLDLSIIRIQAEDHLISHKLIHKGGDIITHFFTRETTLENFLKIENAALSAKDWGGECLGLVRVPLYQMVKNGKKTSRGFPAFLRNEFAGNAKVQLLESIAARNILPHKDLEELFDAYLTS